MAKIDISFFEGIIPRLSARNLSNEQAQIAQNVDLQSTSLNPIKGLTDVFTLPDSSRISIFPYNDSWLSWTTDVDVQRSLIADDTFQRIFYTGDGTPKVRGITAGVEEEFTLGVPAPDNAPTVASQQKASTDWVRTWFYRYENKDTGAVSQSGSLTEGALATEVVETTPGVTYTLTTVPARTTANDSDQFVMYFTAVSATGSFLGTLFPNISSNVADNDLFVDGAAVTGELVNSDSSPNAVLTLSYDTSQSSGYVVDRTYVETFVTKWGEEGPNSDASTIIQIDPTQDAVISGLNAQPAGFANITLRRIYRTVTGSAGTFFQFVVELPIATTTYTDTFSDSELGEVLQSTDWNPPASDLAGLVAMPGSFFAGFSGKTVHFSEVNQPHAWPDNGVTVDFDIVGLGVSENSVIVATTGTPYVITGFEPSRMQASKLSIRQACVSKRGITKVGDTVIYPSPDGLVACQGGIGRLISEPFFKRVNWQDLGPTGFIAEVHDKIYHGWTTTDSIIFDFGEGRSSLSKTDEVTTGLYSDDETDTLYLVQGDKIRSWRTSDTNLTGKWRGKIHTIGKRWSPSWVKIDADSYPQTINLYSDVDSTAVLELAITDDIARKLPVLRDAKEWEIETVFDDNVNRITLASNSREL